MERKVTMNKPKHNWETVHLNPEINGVGDSPRYWDVWTHFQRCTNCGRIEEVDYDGLVTEPNGDEHMLDGWFVTFVGDVDKCEQEVTIGYYVYWNNGDKRYVELQDSPGSYNAINFIPPFTQEEFLADIVTDEVFQKYYEER